MTGYSRCAELHARYIADMSTVHFASRAAEIDPLPNVAHQIIRARIIKINLKNKITLFNKISIALNLFFYLSRPINYLQNSNDHRRYLDPNSCSRLIGQPVWRLVGDKFSLPERNIIFSNPQKIKLQHHWRFGIKCDGYTTSYIKFILYTLVGSLAKSFKT